MWELGQHLPLPNHSFVVTILVHVPGILELHCMTDEQQLLVGGWEQKLALAWNELHSNSENGLS